MELKSDNSAFDRLYAKSNCNQCNGKGFYELQRFHRGTWFSENVTCECVFKSKKLAGKNS